MQASEKGQAPCVHRHFQKIPGRQDALSARARALIYPGTLWRRENVPMSPLFLLQRLVPPKRTPDDIPWILVIWNDKHHSTFRQVSSVSPSTIHGQKIHGTALR